MHHSVVDLTWFYWGKKISVTLLAFNINVVALTVYIPIPIAWFSSVRNVEV